MIAHTDLFFPLFSEPLPSPSPSRPCFHLPSLTSSWESLSPFLDSVWGVGGRGARQSGEPGKERSGLWSGLEQSQGPVATRVVVVAVLLPHS